MNKRKKRSDKGNEEVQVKETGRMKDERRTRGEKIVRRTNGEQEEQWKQGEADETDREESQKQEEQEEWGVGR